jgi:hypothetical protein
MPLPAESEHQRDRRAYPGASGQRGPDDLAARGRLGRLLRVRRRGQVTSSHQATTYTVAATASAAGTIHHAAGRGALSAGTRVGAAAAEARRRNS